MQRNNSLTVNISLYVRIKVTRVRVCACARARACVCVCIFLFGEEGKSSKDVVPDSPQHGIAEEPTD